MTWKVRIHLYCYIIAELLYAEGEQVERDVYLVAHPSKKILVTLSHDCPYMYVCLYTKPNTLKKINTITIGTSLTLDIQVTANRQLSKQGIH